jgi:hypothetical protein
LNTGDIFASLQSDGKVPVFKVSWNIFAMHGAISYAQLFYYPIWDVIRATGFADVNIF